MVISILVCTTVNIGIVLYYAGKTLSLEFNKIMVLFWFAVDGYVPVVPIETEEVENKEEKKEKVEEDRKDIEQKTRERDLLNKDVATAEEKEKD